MKYYTDLNDAHDIVNEYVKACNHRWVKDWNQADVIVTCNLAFAQEAIKTNPYLKIYYMSSSRERVINLDPRVEVLPSWSAFLVRRFFL